jgi:hypothetical protein
METPLYGTEEAKCLMDQYLGGKREASEKREKAANQLLEEFVNFMEQYDLNAKKDVREDTYNITFQFWGVAYFYDNNSILMRHWDRQQNKNEVINLPLYYNNASDLWESRNLDDFVVPEPGKPRKRRDALAELAQHFVNIG